MRTTYLVEFFGLLPALISARPQDSASSISNVIDQINNVIRQRAIKSQKYADYSVKTVSWDDVSRFKTEDGELSVWGNNICDTTLHAKDGRQLYTVRSDNWNEKIGVVSTDQIDLVEGNQENEKLDGVTLADFLKNSEKYGAYVGMESSDLSNATLDKKVSIRFQTTFLPIAEQEEGLPSFQFNSQMYNYASSDDEDPRNLILLATPIGIALQQDGEGTKDIFHHSVRDGSVIQHWFEAEKTNHKVGGEQIEAPDTPKVKGKSESQRLGIASMGKRFNVVMAIQIPLEQKNQPSPDEMYGGNGMWDSEEIAMEMEMPMEMPNYESADYNPMMAPVPDYGYKTFRSEPMKKGQSNAARVNAGDEAGIYKGLGNKSPKRHPSEHITVTVSFYYTVQGGVPSEDDVMAAIDDIENLYESIENGRLADEKYENTFTTKIKKPEWVKVFEKYNFKRGEVRKSQYFDVITADMNDGEREAFLKTFPE